VYSIVETKRIAYSHDAYDGYRMRLFLFQMSEHCIVVARRLGNRSVGQLLNTGLDACNMSLLMSCSGKPSMS
jgi:hypothetical protein